MGNKLEKQESHKRTTANDLENVARELMMITQFKHDEIEAWYNKFMKKCPDGCMTEHEFKKFYTMMCGEAKAEEYAGHVFNTFDLNQNGTIDFREFMIGLNIKSCGDANQKLRWAFVMYDIDKNGFISKEEMQKILHAIYKVTATPDEKATALSKDTTEKVFKEFDTNNDGQLSLEEFVSGAMADRKLREILLNVEPVESHHF